MIGESTDYTDYTDYLSCQQKLFLPTDNTDNTKFFLFGQQITQKINFVIFVSSVGKEEICVICVIC